MNSSAATRTPGAQPMTLTVPDDRLQHEVILASAGSGKTHALSGRYLSLLAAGAKPESILASTFTRLAAGEIRDRLLKRLAEAVDDGKKRSDLAHSLGLKSISHEQAVHMLRMLARNLHVLKVGTLDAFFASVVFAFAFELRLPLDATIVDEPDNQALRLEAVRLMLDEGKPDEMVELLRLLTRGDPERNVTLTIDRLVRDLYDQWRETTPAAWECVLEVAGRLSRTELIEALDRLANCALPKDKRFADARRSEHIAAMARDWTDFLNSGLAKKVLQRDYVYYGKAIPRDAIESYQTLVQHAVAELVGRLRGQTIATRDLLARFHRHYEALKHQRRVLTFSDLTHAMARAERDAGAMDVIGFRLDAALQHMLLDEFQDTSIAQWHALRPLAGEMLAHAPPERTFFCVGDVKQSIYGWRNANPEILERLPDALPEGTARPLDESWRSSPIVIDVVNEVFASLASNAALAPRDEDDTDYADAATLWQGAFNRHAVAEPKRSLAGYVQMRLGPAAQGKQSGAKAEQNRRRLRAAAQLAADLHRANPHARIALLTRTNAAVARLLYELGSDRFRVPASGRGGGPLIDAPPVNALLDLLHLADHPDDTVSAFNVATSPLGTALGFTECKHAGQRRRFSRQTREALLRDGYQRTIAKWVQAIAPACDARELRRAAQMVELAGTHDRQQSGGEPALRPGDFISLVESKDVPDSQPAPVEVMTVHQAKGLEFDAVILAELGEQLRGNREPAVVFEREERSGEIARICRWIGSDVRGFLPELQPMIRQHRIRAIRESLSVLYVAMTRPRHALYLIVDPPSDNEKNLPRSPGGVLRAALADPATGDAPESVVFESGDPQWWKQVGPARADTSHDSRCAAAVCDRITLARDGGETLRGESATSASMFAERARARKQAAALREQLQLISPEGRERGTVIHALFEQIEWLEEFALDDDALVKVSQMICPRRDERWHRKQVAAFRTMLQKPVIRAALSRGSAAPASIRLHREHPFARIVNGLVQTGAIDRLVLQVDGDDRIGGAKVIDFKTDALERAPQGRSRDLGLPVVSAAVGVVRAQAETHRVQLEMYRDAVAEVFGLPPEKIAMQVLLVGAGAAVDL